MVLAEALLITVLGGVIGLGAASLSSAGLGAGAAAILPGARHAREHLRCRRGALVVLGTLRQRCRAPGLPAEDRRRTAEGLVAMASHAILTQIARRHGDEPAQHVASA